MTLAALLALGTLLAVAAVLAAPWLDRRRRRRVGRAGMPPHWRAILGRQLPLYALMPPQLQRELEHRVLVFLDEKRFVGCGGLEVDEEMRVAIAAQACLLLLNRDTDYYPGLTAILVYPSSFVSPHEHEDAAGVHHLERRVLAGESWHGDRVVLSWPEVDRRGREVSDGVNVVVHEFAHQLDSLHSGDDESASITLRLPALREAYTQLRRVPAHRHRSPIDRYGTTSPTEFFACAVEAFIEAAPALAEDEPALYAALVDLFRIDPAAWLAEH